MTCKNLDQRGSSLEKKSLNATQKLLRFKLAVPSDLKYFDRVMLSFALSNDTNSMPID
jgi:hypothetical protein